MSERIRAYEGGVFAIETGYGYEGYDDAYLIVDTGRAAFVDSGVNASVPRLIEALHRAGLQEESVDWVLLTHVHLDHAGGAGELMARLPNAKLGIHSRGARHMADPTQLMSAVIAVYGEAMVASEYGVLRPIPEERIVVLEEGQSLTVGSREISVIDSPGHARHHLAFWDSKSQGWFTGDAFGLCVPGFRFEGGDGIYVSSSPSQFDPETYLATIDKILATDPRYVYPTHSGRVAQPERLAEGLRWQLNAIKSYALSEPSGEDLDDRLSAGLLKIYAESLRRQGWQGSDDRVREVMGIDLKLNLEGIKIWRHHSLLRN